MSEINIVIKLAPRTAGDKKHKVAVSTSSTIQELKEQLAKDLDIPVDRQRLIYSGKVLKDGDTIESYKIKDGHSLHLVKGAAKTDSTSRSSASTTQSAAGNSSAAASGSGSIPSNISAGQSTFDPLAGLTSARYAGYNVPLPTLEQMGMNPDGMQIPDDNQLEQMMENPLFQESMRGMLSDPRMLDFMIQQSPQLRAMGPMAREMLQSDQFRNMITNPQAMRSMMQFQRTMNPNEASAQTGSFPAPGNPITNESSGTDAAASSNSGNAGTAGAAGAAGSSGSTGSTAALPPNPFAALFGVPNSNTAANTNENTIDNNAGTTAANPATNPFANPNLWNMLSGLSGAANASQPPAPVDNRPPEEVFQSQLRQLNDMGFFDFERNVRALRRSGGSVEGAVDELLNGSV
ncbi:hypothetical protein FOA43_000658 [Brettanomyces nanus]|uniref:Ubiquitin domain-containing protein DSK2 n=1 Tax=Eeniella nana TaxID=13502 RepID=A0A875RXI0_EENNA|nr:uncharacterized protein FOA43_000658 [Brettanomyces nanus]QPG73348.1 hypothetical protein FOA43_000658 [Brettanomyces nanus]